MYLFLDFDGVLCDSAKEAYHVSHSAYRDFCNTKQDQNHEDQFRRLRPFVQSADDFILLQKIIHEKILISTQEEFDTFKRGFSEKDMQSFDKIFYQFRHQYMMNDYSKWISWQPLYSGITALLRKLALNPMVYIISNKQSEFICELLSHHSIYWDVKRIYYAHAKVKSDIILQISPAEEAVFIDDCEKHLVTAAKQGITCYLANWGYTYCIDFKPQMSLTDFTQYLKKIVSDDMLM